MVMAGSIAATDAELQALSINRQVLHDCPSLDA
jgi:hypothetical protein